MTLNEIVKKLFKKKEVEEECVWYKTSRDQLEIHIKEDLDKKWINVYAHVGCYQCDGKHKQCSVYYKRI